MDYYWTIGLPPGCQHVTPSPGNNIWLEAAIQNKRTKRCTLWPNLLPLQMFMVCLFNAEVLMHSDSSLRLKKQLFWQHCWLYMSNFQAANFTGLSLLSCIFNLWLYFYLGKLTLECPWCPHYLCISGKAIIKFSGTVTKFIKKKTNHHI